MSIKPTVTLRAMYAEGVAAFAKIGGTVKAIGPVKVGAAIGAIISVATAVVSVPKQDPNNISGQSLTSEF